MKIVNYLAKIVKLKAPLASIAAWAVGSGLEWICIDLQPGAAGERRAEKSLAEIRVMESPDTDHWLSKGEQESLHMCSTAPVL